MATNKIVGIILVVIGAGLAIWGHQMSGSFGSQLNQAFSGSPSDKVMACYIGGAASLVVGLFLLFKK